MGDNIRLTMKRKRLIKERWIEEVCKISKIQLTIPVTYKITDYIGEEIQGSFMTKNIKRTTQDIFRAEKK